MISCGKVDFELEILVQKLMIQVENIIPREEVDLTLFSIPSTGQKKLPKSINKVISVTIKKFSVVTYIQKKTNDEGTNNCFQISENVSTNTLSIRALFVIL